MTQNSQSNTTSSGFSSKQPKKKPFIILWFGLIIILVIFAFLVYQTLFASVQKDKQMITIEKGETYYKLIDKWAENNPLFIQPLAKLYIKLQVAKPLHAGTYQIPANPNFKQLMDILQQGEKVALVKVQIIEGKTAKDLYKILNASPTIKKEVIQDRNIDIQALNLPVNPEYTPNGNLEGWFAPDTYYYNETATDKKILTDLFEKQHKVLMENWETRQDNLPYKNPYEALIMASIIEKETSLASERGEVAGVFVNRLRQGMRLQTDPTVIYGMGERYDGNIRKKDLLEKTPYNTYQINGLPPTPIALPSEASIKSALNPNKTDSLYFVATGKGGHKFSSNLNDHNKAVQEYLQVMREKKAQQNQ